MNMLLKLLSQLLSNEEKPKKRLASKPRMAKKLPKLEIEADPEELLTALEALEAARRKMYTQQYQILRDNKSARIFSQPEMTKLGSLCIGYLKKLEHLGILNTMSREIVIDQLMISDIDMSVNNVEWAVVRILQQLPNTQTALACMEQLVLHDRTGWAH